MKIDKRIKLTKKYLRKAYKLIIEAIEVSPRGDISDSVIELHDDFEVNLIVVDTAIGALSGKKQQTERETTDEARNDAAGTRQADQS
jgi:hypothetical protein